MVGTVYHGMAPLEAIETFAILSIGNALLTTLPAFLISTAMGLMVTRVAGDGALGVDLAAQLLARPDVLRVAAVLVFALAFVPAFPGPLFASLGIVAFGGALLAERQKRRVDAHARAAYEQRRREAVRRPETAFGLVGVDALSIDVGADLYALLAPPNSEALLDRVADVRRALAAETGIVIPGVRLRDDPLRDPRTYALRVRDRVVAEGIVRLDRLVAVAAPDVLARHRRRADDRTRLRPRRALDRVRGPRARATRRCADVRRDLDRRLAPRRDRARARGRAVRPARVPDAGRAPARDGARRW